LILEDPCDVQAYPPGDTLVSRQAAGYSYAWDDQGIVTAIQIEFNLALGDAKSGLEVMNPKIPSEAADSMAMPWLAVE